MLTSDPLSLDITDTHPERLFFGAYAPHCLAGLSAGLHDTTDSRLLDLHVSCRVGQRQVAVHGVFTAHVGPQHLRAGPLHLQVDDGTLTVDLDESAGVAMQARFIPSGPPFAEPHYLFPTTRPLFDYRRRTQSGRWSGGITVDGLRLPLDHVAGIRDRSQGRRPAFGAPGVDTFWWLWIPCRFPGGDVLFATNDLPHGGAWNRFALWGGDPGGAGHFDSYDLELVPGTRHVRTARLRGRDLSGSPVELRLDATSRLLMYGLGYGNPGWPHDVSSGTRPAGRQDLDLPALRTRLPRYFHTQSPCVAELYTPGRAERGEAVMESLLIGSRPSLGLREMFDVAR